MLRNVVIAKGLRRLRTIIKVMWSPTDMGAAGLVIGADGRVLLVRHSYQAGWSLPGGSVGRNEPPAQAVMRELQEEVGLSGGMAELAGIFTRSEGWATNVVAMYHVTGGAVNFRPNWEIREILWVDAHAPPPGTTPGTLRRLAEYRGAAVSLWW